MSEVFIYLAEKKFVIALFFDFKKAFDTLKMDTLLKAVGQCGMREPLNKWFQNNLIARSYSVKMGEALSKERTVRCRVAQDVLQSSKTDCPG